MHKFELKTRLHIQQITGSNIAPESQLYLAGANPEEMAENKFTRSAGIVPAAWNSFGSNYNHFQAGGGLNIRGYAGYLTPVVDNNKQYLFYAGDGGAAINMELDFDNYFNFKPRFLSNYHLDMYLFGDAGVLQQNTISSSLLASAGPGFTLTIKRWSYLDELKPLNIRFDMPIFMSNAPFVDNENIKFRWLIGINRCF